MNPPTLPSISIAIPTHRRRKRLPELLDALAGEPAVEIAVVANNSPDGSLELLESRAERDPRIRAAYIENADKNAALRKAVSLTSAEVVLMLDDDVIPEPGLLEGHARHHATARNLVVVGYMPVARRPHRRPGEFPTDLYSRAYELTCDEYERDPDRVLTALWAGNVSMRRADCLRVGFAPSEGIPEGFAYHEDRDLGLRCRAAGMRGVFDRKLLARHMYDRSVAGFMRSARESGITRAAIHREHAAAVGSLDDRFFECTVPMPGRLLVRAARRRWCYQPVQGFLTAVTAVAGRLHLFKLESHAGYVMGTIEQQRAALASGSGNGSEM